MRWCRWRGLGESCCGGGSSGGESGCGFGGGGLVTAVVVIETRVAGISVCWWRWGVGKNGGGVSESGDGVRVIIGDGKESYSPTWVCLTSCDKVTVKPLVMVVVVVTLAVVAMG